MDRQDLLFDRSVGMSLAKSILLLFPMEKRKAEVGGRYYTYIYILFRDPKEVQAFWPAQCAAKLATD